MIFSISTLLFLLSTTLLPIHCYHWSGNVLYDLEFQGLNFFTEAEAWNCTAPLVTPEVKATFCGSDTILAGYNVMGPPMASSLGKYWYRTYDNLPPHNAVKLQITVYAIDSWDGQGSNDHFEITFDNTNLVLWTLLTYVNHDPMWYATTDICGSTDYNDLPPLNTYITMAHSADNLTLKFINGCNEESTNESVGFRGIILTFFNQTPTVSTSYCGVASSGYPMPNHPCTCAAGTTMTSTSSGLCGPCHSSCATCNGPSSSSCVTCNAGSYLKDGSCLNCISPCATCNGDPDWCISCETGLFLINSTCHLCPAPLSQTLSGWVWYCVSPCQLDEFVLWDGGCASTCDYPLFVTTVANYSICNFPCADITEHLYWNGSCISGCPSPLNGANYHSRYFCSYDCAIDEYLYWNGSCAGNCPAPLTWEIQGTNETRLFCWYPCQPGEYLYWNGSCLENCSLPLSSEIQGTVDPRNFCWYTCQPDEYLYWNGSCLSTCPSPLTPEVQGEDVQRKFCWYTCQFDEFLYWNGSCISQCPLPLSSEIQGVNDTRLFCWYTCQPNQYLFWNGSCLNGCPSPLTPETQGMNLPRKFCWYACQPNDFLFWNMSCLTSCPPLLISETQGVTEFRNFCQSPCPSNQYLSWNGSCLPKCPLPLMIVNDPGISYCFRPCDYPNIYWYKNNTCLSSCDYPHRIIPYSQVLQCLSPCSKDSEYFYDLEKKCHSKCEYPYEKRMIDVVKICHFDITVTLEETDSLLSKAAAIKTQGKYTSGSMKAASLLSSSNPAFALLAGLSAMLQYIRYMKVNYPPRVEVFFMITAVDPISLYLNFEIPNFVQNKLIDYDLPYAFEKYEINSNFVNNLWDFLMTLAVSLLAIVVFILLEFMSRRFSKINRVMAKVLKVLKWNTPLAMICSSSGDIFFYSSLQFMSSPLDSTASIVCFVLCLVMITSVIALFAVILGILKSFQLHRRRKGTRENEDWKEKWSSWEILFVEYEEKSLFSLGYLALFILRGMVFNLTIANLYNFPLVQSIIITIANFLMYGYLLYFRPLKELLGIVQLFITEGIVFIVTVCVLMLAIMDKAHKDGQPTRVGVGDVIVFLIQAFNILALAFMAVSLLLSLISAYKIWKQLRAQGVKSPIKMLEMILFEDLEAKMATAERSPKIYQSPSTEKSDLNRENKMINFETTVDNLPVERSVQLSEENFLTNSMMKSQVHQSPAADGLAITEFDSIPTLFEQDSKGSPGMRFRGLDETVIEEIKMMDECVLEKKVSSLGNVEGMETSIGASSTRIDMFESLRKLKTRMNRFGNVNFQKEEEKKWFDNIRKLKVRLKTRPNNPGITLESQGSNLE